MPQLPPLKVPLMLPVAKDIVLIKLTRSTQQFRIHVAHHCIDCNTLFKKKHSFIFAIIIMSSERVQLNLVLICELESETNGWMNETLKTNEPFSKIYHREI
jgi:hypothetical protein